MLYSYGLLFGCFPSMIPTVHGPSAVSSPSQSLAFVFFGNKTLRLSSHVIGTPTRTHVLCTSMMRSSSLTYFLSSLLGEIDIMEARGNGPSYPRQYVIFPNFHRLFSLNYITDPSYFLQHRGSNYVRGSLNWGPLTWLNAVSKTFGWWSLRRGSYDQDFHTYALEWDQNFMYVSFLLSLASSPYAYHFHLFCFFFQANICRYAPSSHAGLNNERALLPTWRLPWSCSERF